MKNQIKFLSLLSVAFLSASAFAGVEKLPTMKEADADISVAQMIKTIPLKKVDSHNRTRVNIAVVDLGGSTDVSPTIGLYLTFWSDGEMGDAAATIDLGNAYGLIDYSISPAGKVVLETKQLGDNGFYVQRMVVDYSDFLKKFEKAADSIPEDFTNVWVEGEVSAVIKP